MAGAAIRIGGEPAGAGFTAGLRPPQPQSVLQLLAETGIGGLRLRLPGFRWASMALTGLPWAASEPGALLGPWRPRNPGDCNSMVRISPCGTGQFPGIICLGCSGRRSPAFAALELNRLRPGGSFLMVPWSPGALAARSVCPTTVHSRRGFLEGGARAKRGGLSDGADFRNP